MSRAVEPDRTQSLVIASDPLPIRIPRLFPGTEYGIVQVTLLSSSKVYAIWEFPFTPKLQHPELMVSPAYLDRYFVTLRNGDDAPVARFFEGRGIPGISEEMFLQIETRSPVKQLSRDRYRLKWLEETGSQSGPPMWEKAKVPPILWFHVELTNHCNLSCHFCPSRMLRRKRQYMPMELAGRIFEQISRYQRKTSHYAGYTRLHRMVFPHIIGEPLLHPEFGKMLSLAQEHDILLALFTNATLLEDKSIGNILGAGVPHMTLSLNVTRNREDPGSRRYDAVEKQEQRVLNLLQRRLEEKATYLHVDIQYMRSPDKGNLNRGLVETRDEAWKLYSRWLYLIRHLERDMVYDASYRQIHDFPSTINIFRALSEGEACLRLPLSHNIDMVLKDCCSFGNVILDDSSIAVPTTRGRCPFDNPSRVMCIFVDGSVSFCSFDHENSVCLGNILEEPIESLWKGERLQHIRSEMEKGHLVEPLCQRCLGSISRKEIKPSGVRP